MSKHVEIDAEQYALQRDELDELRRRNKDLEWVLSVVSGLQCSELHHAAEHLHLFDDPCPVEERILRIINQEAKS